jgi:hypothetical protein
MNNHADLRPIAPRDGSFTFYIKSNESNGRHVVTPVDEYGGDKWYVLYVADCFDPPLYAMRADSFEDAYEDFICLPSFVKFYGIGPDEAADYEGMDPETGEGAPAYNDNGDAVDTESVQALSYDPMDLYCVRFPLSFRS